MDADRAYCFAQDDRFMFRFYEEPQLTGDYVVADPPLIGTEPRRTDEGNIVNIPTVTVYMAIEELWKQMDQQPESK